MAAAPVALRVTVVRVVQALHATLAVVTAVEEAEAMMAVVPLAVLEEREAHQAEVEAAVVAQMPLVQVEQEAEARCVYGPGSS